MPDASSDGNIHCKQIQRKRDFSQENKTAVFSFQDLSCWLTPSSAHALVMLAAWSVQLCQGTWSIAWDFTSPWGVSGTQKLSGRVVVSESMCESCAAIYLTDSPTRNNSGNCRLQPDGPGSVCVSAAAAEQQPGEDLDTGGEVQRDLDRDRRHLPNVTACQGKRRGSGNITFWESEDMWKNQQRDK